jgi:hypothetical protein
VDIPIAPFPSDHRAVVSTLRVQPVVPPLFVAFDRKRIVIGEPFVVRYHAPQGEATDRIVIVRAGDDAVSEALMSLPPYEAEIHGSVTFGSAGLEPDEYEAVLLGEGGQELARNNAWLVTADAPVMITATKGAYQRGEPITINWANSPGNRADWIGIYADGESDLYNYTTYIYTEGAVSGSATLTAEAFGEGGLPPGRYRAILMLDDIYAVLGSTVFTVGQ